MTYSEDTFTHDGRKYDLNKIRQLTKHAITILVPIGELLWVLKYDHPDEERVKHAKIRYPLLCARYKGKLTIVDGLHRLERYRRRGIEVIPVRMVTDEMLKEALIKKK